MSEGGPGGGMTAGSAAVGCGSDGRNVFGMRTEVLGTKAGKEMRSGLAGIEGVAAGGGGAIGSD